jgi:hypothetical protein|tara:strand:+ start:326 stop:559 length:234 start_codon:yes stop_codon:yes gene_type:complete
MKKQKKQNKQVKPEITPEDIMGDFEKIMSLVGKIENEDVLKLDINEIDKQSEILRKEIEDKYNPIIKKLKDNLDSEE